MKLALLALAILCVFIPCAIADTVTLKSGEIVQGDILSETDTDLVIMAVNQSRTISSRRNILKSDIQTVDRESAQQKQARAAYETLEDRLRLDPNREFSKAEYENGIQALNNYLTTYPDSKVADDARKLLATWKDELAHVEQGDVKFGNRWMTPQDKNSILEKLNEKQRLQSLPATMQGLQKKVQELENHRVQVDASIESIQKAIASCQSVINNPPRVSVITHTVIPATPPQYDSNGRMTQPGSPARPGLDKVQYIADTQAVARTQQRLSAYQAQLSQTQQQMLDIEDSIRNTKRQIAQAQSEYKVATLEVQQPLGSIPAAHQPVPPQPTTVTQQTLASTSQQVVVAAAPQPTGSMEPQSAPKPWIQRYWKGLAIVGGILLLVILVVPPVLKRAERKEAEREEQRRVARQQLKKIFDQIFVQGERPSGKNIPEGEIIPFGNARETTGSGRWFVIGPSHIWAVQDNGRENDNWVLNNVETGGPGAIGARVELEADIVNSIRTLAGEAS
ncbi:MAG TPA: hypothetical protein VL171_18510 [Verrucomicrobiae bacterium]|nr:hypothetical protein [Verrucomicrobiae bacterium]